MEKNKPNPDSTTMAPLTEERSTQSNAIEIPSISLPKGGGALKGIDEKFEVNAANGTASFGIPLPFSPARNGFNPSLSLAYNSGGGNSPFGLGWDIDLPSIQRKTDKGLPRYGDGGTEDIFTLSGVEDLVPFLKEEDNWTIKEQKVGDFHVQQYRPRIEASFARIERISHPNFGVYWKVTAPTNEVTFYGRSPSARIVDPKDESRIYRWLPDFAYDGKGNWIQYEYKKEDLINIPNEVYEKNRLNGLASFTNVYLKSIKYGNRIAYFADPTQPYDPPLPANKEHFFELILDYGEHDSAMPSPLDDGQWDYRPDAFSSYRSGFEIRSCRLCKRILMFHHFKDEKQFVGTEEEEVFGDNYLVRSLRLTHESSSINASQQSETTYLKSITQIGYIRKPDGTYSPKSLPPMEFTYEKLHWNKTIKTASPDSIINAPVGLSNNYQWVDLYGEGISGMLTEQGGDWFYKSNLGEVEKTGAPNFTIAKKVMPKPSFAGLSDGLLSIQDLAANGEKQIVINNKELKGYFELTSDNEWEPFRSFEQIANIDFADPNTRLIDLNGDGQAEIVVTEENAFTWYAADGKKGYLPAERTPKPFDEEQGPAIVFSDQLQTIFLADMSGDGLTDIVRIRNGEVCYWPNKGYGRFGAKVSMGNAPVFDHPDKFNPQYLHLADVSGTGATDMIYLGKNKFKAFINLSGNAWSETHEIEPFLPVNKNSQLSVVDLLGTGTSCIVWSSDLPAHANAPMRYIDLMSSKKPHVMIKHINNMGKETSVEYKSSTWFYLKDKKEGKPWFTKLPFPVQVVHKTIVEEKVTNVRFTSEYRYRHGYYDHAEREFRGFGMVEQLDTEFFDVFEKSEASNTTTEELYQPPVLTKTWFHTGAFFDRKKILSLFESEYWYHHLKEVDIELDPIECQLPDAIILGADNLLEFSVKDLDAEEYREALRACKGMMLRQEVFALDAADETDFSQQIKQLTPYTVATHNCEIQVLQTRGDNPYAVFIVKESEAITYYYERNPTDPRIAHTLNIETDEYGNILESVSVVYPRIGTEPLLEDEPTDNHATQMAKEAGRKGQQKMWITFTKNDFTNDIIENADYQLRKGWQSRTYELTGKNILEGQSIFKVSDFQNIIDELPEIPYYETADENTSQKRLIEHLKSKFYDELLTTPLPDGEQNKWGIAYENYQLAFTPDLLETLFTPSQYAAQFSISNDDMEEGRFVLDHDKWWTRSGVVHFSKEGENFEEIQNRFFTPIAYTDPFDTTIEAFPDPYFLFMEKSVDPLGNEHRVLNFNYRTLSPDRMIDLNDNIASVLTDELGLVKATAMEGKDSNEDGVGEEGDNLWNLQELTDNAEQDLIEKFFTTAQGPDVCDYGQLKSFAHELLQNAGTRLIYNFGQTPTVAASIVREKHFREDPDSPLQITLEYSDGLGNVVMTKVQAEPGWAKSAQLQADDTWLIKEVNTEHQLRWVGNGRTVLNNKGNPIKQYEPYFSVTPAYETAPALVESGVTPTLFYDALGRLIKTEMPDDTFSKVAFDAWKQINFDANDTVEDSDWYAHRMTLLNNDPQRQAAEKAKVHHGTPSYLFLDTLGRPTLGADHNRKLLGEEGVLYYTHSKLDIEGNALSVTDARNNVVMSWKYDMLGHRVFQDSMDAGKRWMFNNAIGHPVKLWDERRHTFAFEYDILQRPISKLVSGGENDLPLTRFEYIVYGEADQFSNPEVNNLRGQAVFIYDTAGKIINDQYDFKGNLLSSTRIFAKDYKNTPDWSGDDLDSLLESSGEYAFDTKTEYDAINRPIRQFAPDGSNGEPDSSRSVTIPTYNEAGFLGSMTIEKAGTTTHYVQNIDYDAKGQRTQIQYGNGIRTKYTYEPETFRLIQLRTTKAENEVLQDLNYTYDPMGNITQIEDLAIAVEFFSNSLIEPKSEYTYDSLYRLIAATGRERSSNHNYNASENWRDASKIPPPTNPNQLRNYRQAYQYDSVGNILEMRHIANGGSWTRRYEYETNNNRLISTRLGNTTYHYPHHAQHGFIHEMSHLSRMDWNFKEELQATSSQVTHDGPLPETTYYVYDGSGQRVRKITETINGAGIKNERLYVGNMFEVYRQQDGLERETLHLMDDSSRIAMIDTRTKGHDEYEPQTIRYQLGNHLGSVSLEVNQHAEIISYEEYHPYGTTAYQAKNANIRTAAKRYRYTGMERDEETGMNYHSARYYLLWLGRWLSADPIGIGDGGNLYGYVHNGPTVYVDFVGTKKTYGGLSVSKESKITAAQIVEMIHKSKKLTPFMKSLIDVDGDKIVLTQNPQRIRLPRGVSIEDLPKWFQSFLRVVATGKYQITTATSIVNHEGDANDALRADTEDGDSIKGPSPNVKRDSVILGETASSEGILNEGEPGKKSPEVDVRRKMLNDPPSDSSRKKGQGLIVISIAIGVDTDFLPESNVIFSMKRDPDAILETLFHEVYAHAELDLQGRDSSHGPNWREIQITTADIRAKEVADWFETEKRERLLVEAVEKLTPKKNMIINFDKWLEKMVEEETKITKDQNPSMSQALSLLQVTVSNSKRP